MFLPYCSQRHIDVERDGRGGALFYSIFNLSHVVFKQYVVEQIPTGVQVFVLPM